MSDYKLGILFLLFVVLLIFFSLFGIFGAVPTLIGYLFYILGIPFIVICFYYARRYFNKLDAKNKIKEGRINELRDDLKADSMAEVFTNPYSRETTEKLKNANENVIWGDKVSSTIEYSKQGRSDTMKNISKTADDIDHTFLKRKLEYYEDEKNRYYEPEFEKVNAEVKFRNSEAQKNRAEAFRIRTIADAEAQKMLKNQTKENIEALEAVINFMNKADTNFLKDEDLKRMVFAIFQNNPTAWDEAKYKERTFKQDGDLKEEELNRSKQDTKHKEDNINRKKRRGKPK